MAAMALVTITLVTLAMPNMSPATLLPTPLHVLSPLPSHLPACVEEGNGEGGKSHGNGNGDKTGSGDSGKSDGKGNKMGEGKGRKRDGDGDKEGNGKGVNGDGDRN